MPSAVKARRNQMMSQTVERVRRLEKDKGARRETLQDIGASSLYPVFLDR